MMKKNVATSPTKPSTPNINNNTAKNLPSLNYPQLKKNSTNQTNDGKSKLIAKRKFQRKRLNYTITEQQQQHQDQPQPKRNSSLKTNLIRSNKFRALSLPRISKQYQRMKQQSQKNQQQKYYLEKRLSDLSELNSHHQTLKIQHEELNSKLKILQKKKQMLLRLNLQQNIQQQKQQAEQQKQNKFIKIFERESSPKLKESMDQLIKQIKYEERRNKALKQSINADQRQLIRLQKQLNKKTLSSYQSPSSLPIFNLTNSHRNTNIITNDRISVLSNSNNKYCEEYQVQLIKQLEAEKRMLIQSIKVKEQELKGKNKEKIENQLKDQKDVQLMQNIKAYLND